MKPETPPPESTSHPPRGPARVADGLPRVRELIPAPDPVRAFQQLDQLPYCLFLDSALRRPQLGRYSFLMADPFEFLEGVDWNRLSDRLARYRTASRPDLPPFQGGLAGLFSYDLSRDLERVPAARYDEFELPRIACGLYDVVLAFDHEAGRAWLISHGFPQTDPQARDERARDREQFFLEMLNGSSPPLFRADTVGRSRPAPLSAAPLSASDLAPQFEIADWPGLTSNFSPSAYRQTIERAVEYILAGDIFQVNIAQRLLHPAVDDPRALYLRLRQRNPAPFAAYFDLGASQIVSASPERFLSVREGLVEARPIKGTRQRTARPEADLFAGDELRESEKDRAENVMIVDLLRNDLSRVCEADSVKVPQLCGLETYEFVQHLVSVVTGRLAPGYGPLDLIRAAFPGGSITGAPKVRAMEIIAELEPTARGAYCGSLGYLGFDGTMDLNILIRTITAGRGWWQIPVGGGIVAQSTPTAEYEETWHKARGMLRALAR